MTDPATVAAGLTKKQREFVRNDAFVPNRNSRRQIISACHAKGLISWNEGLSPLGEAVRKILEAQDG